MKRLTNKIKFFRAFIKLVQDPNTTANIFRMSEAVLRNPDQKSAQNFVDCVMENQNFQKLFQEKYLAPKITADALRKFSEGSLGKAYGDFLAKHILEMDFYPELASHNELEYLTLRLRQTHDIFHVLTNYGCTLEDEAAMQAFLVAQTGSAFSGLLVVAALLHTLKSQPKNLKTLFAAVSEGYRRGQHSAFLLGVPWEMLWDRSLAELQSQYGILERVSLTARQKTTDDFDQFIDLGRVAGTVTT